MARRGDGLQAFGLIVASARSRRCRAISIGSPVRTSFAASRQTSCCAERISPAMISIARSLRRKSPAMRYQTFSARVWGSIGGDHRKALYG